jgi:hypothetical protein
MVSLTDVISYDNPLLRGILQATHYSNIIPPPVPNSVSFTITKIRGKPVDSLRQLFSSKRDNPLFDYTIRGADDARMGAKMDLWAIRAEGTHLRDEYNLTQEETEASG